MIYFYNASLNIIRMWRFARLLCHFNICHSDKHNWHAAGSGIIIVADADGWMNDNNDIIDREATVTAIGVHETHMQVEARTCIWHGLLVNR